MIKTPSFLPALIAGFVTIVASGIASADTLFVAENGGRAIAEVNSVTGATTLIEQGKLANPTGLAFDSAGNLFIANTGDGSLDEYSNGSLTTLETGLVMPRGLAFDSNGALYIANQGNGVISKLSGGVLSKFATGLDAPNGIAIDGDGTLYVANGGNNTITKITSAGAKSTLTINGPALLHPNGIVFGPGGDLYVVNHSTDLVEKIDPLTGDATSVLTDNSLQHPKTLAFDSEGNLYVTDNTGNAVAEYDLVNGEYEFLKKFTTDQHGPCFIIVAPDETLSVPEPSTYAMLLSGLAAFYFLRRRQRVPVRI